MFKFAPIITPENRHIKRPLILTSNVHIDKLSLQEAQQHAINTLYAQPGVCLDEQFTVDQQSAAKLLLQSYGLSEEEREKLGHKWNLAWSKRSWQSIGGVKRELYQCCCGQDHTARKSQTRRIAFPYTGCLAHIEITVNEKSGAMLRIQGFPTHHDTCKNASLERMPRLPLHPSVIDVALQQMANGASLTEIQEKNLRLSSTRGYSGQEKTDTVLTHRWLLRSHDTTSLYRQFLKRQGVDTKKQAHLNIHSWLDPTSPHYNRIIASSVFHYAARTTSESRLEICIATSEMREAAWRYGHQKQILVDGTFGVCNQKLLLFIVMGIDDEFHGVPLAFLLFSAPGGNNATASGYDTAILTRLLQKWKEALNTRGQTSFAPCAAITDTDLKERGALLAVFPDIILLLCRFHLRQSWHNHQNKVLRGLGATQAFIKKRLRIIEDQLVRTLRWSDMKKILESERAELHNLVRKDSLLEPAVSRGLAHLEYLEKYWGALQLWACWSDHGLEAAAQQMGIPVDRVAPTTNHVERLNGTLKHKYLVRWAKGGRRVRTDVLIVMLAQTIPYSMFEKRRLQHMERLAIQKALAKIPGGQKVVEDRVHQKGPIEAALAYLVQDAGRDEAAKEILRQRAISYPAVESTGLRLTCASLRPLGASESCPTYYVWLGFDGVGSCSCPDFVNRGGACKHMRAALHVTTQMREWARQQGHVNDPLLRSPPIQLPPDKLSAITLRASISTQYETSDGTMEAYRVDRTNNKSPGFVQTVNGRYHDDEPSSVDGDEEDCEWESEDGEEVVWEEASDDEFDFEAETESEGGWWSSDDEDAVVLSGNHKGLGIQALARGTYDIQKVRPLVANLNTVLEQTRYEQLRTSEHRNEYMTLLNDLERLTARLHGLLRPDIRPLPTNAPQDRVSIGLGLPASVVPIPPSPERRQKRINSHSIH